MFGAPPFSPTHVAMFAYLRTLAIVLLAWPGGHLGAASGFNGGGDEPPIDALRAGIANRLVGGLQRLSRPPLLLAFDGRRVSEGLEVDVGELLLEVGKA